MILYLLTLTINSWAITDFTCMTDCQKKGYVYSLCQSKCSTPDTNSGSQNTISNQLVNSGLQSSKSAPNISGALNNGAQLGLQRQQIQLQQESEALDREMKRIDRVGKDMDIAELCFKRADRHFRKMTKSDRAKLSEIEADDLVKEIVNECCLEHGCKGI